MAYAQGQLSTSIDVELSNKTGDFRLDREVPLLYFKKFPVDREYNHSFPLQIMSTSGHYPKEPVRMGGKIPLAIDPHYITREPFAFYEMPEEPPIRDLVSIRQTGDGSLYDNYDQVITALQNSSMRMKITPEMLNDKRNDNYRAAVPFNDDHNPNSAYFRSAGDNTQILPVLDRLARKVSVNEFKQAELIAMNLINPNLVNMGQSHFQQSEMDTNRDLIIKQRALFGNGSRDGSFEHRLWRPVLVAWGIDPSYWAQIEQTEITAIIDKSRSFISMIFTEATHEQQEQASFYQNHSAIFATVSQLFTSSPGTPLERLQNAARFIANIEYGDASKACLTNYGVAESISPGLLGPVQLALSLLPLSMHLGNVNAFCTMCYYALLEHMITKFFKNNDKPQALELLRTLHNNPVADFLGDAATEIAKGAMDLGAGAVGSAIGAAVGGPAGAAAGASIGVTASRALRGQYSGAQFGRNLSNAAASAILPKLPGELNGNGQLRRFYDNNSVFREVTRPTRNPLRNQIAPPMNNARGANLLRIQNNQRGRRRTRRARRNR